MTTIRLSVAIVCILFLGTAALKCSRSGGLGWRH